LGWNDVITLNDILGNKRVEKTIEQIEQGSFWSAQNLYHFRNSLGSHILLTCRQSFFLIFGKNNISGRTKGYEMVLATELWHWGWSYIDINFVLDFVALSKKIKMLVLLKHRDLLCTWGIRGRWVLPPQQQYQ
jgi:hypothetical protein